MHFDSIKLWEGAKLNHLRNDGTNYFQYRIIVKKNTSPQVRDNLVTAVKKILLLSLVQLQYALIFKNYHKDMHD